MLNPTYLTLSRHNVFYFRWPLPRNLRQAGKTSHLKFSLRTREPKQALRLANALEYHMSALFQKGCGAGMDFSEMKKQVEEYFRTVLESEKAQIDRNGPYPPEKAAEYQRLLARNMDLQAFNRFREELNAFIPERPDIQLKLLRELTGIKRSDPDYKLLSELYRHGAISYFQSLLHYSQDQARFSFTPANQPVADFMPDGVQTEETLLFLVEKFSAEMLALNAWGKKSIGERAEFFQLLADLLGEDIPFRNITLVHARNVKDVLMRLPKNRNKIKETRGLPVREQISVEGVERLSVTSVNKYLQCYNGLFSWAVKNGYIDKNPFESMALKSAVKKRRDQFTPDQIQLMLAALKDKKTKAAIADHAYWGSIIGIYTGARLNEIASLTPDDIRAENGIWYFDINDQDEMKRLKTTAAKRRVPIHSAVLALGFLDYVQAIRAMNTPDIRLLHTLTYSEKEGWGRNLGRWFNTTFLGNLGIKKPGLSFHSLRHTAITTMRRAGVERPIVQALVGHEPDGVTEEVYTHGYELAQLQKAVETLKF